MAHVEHFREIIGIIKAGVNCAVGEEVGGENDNGRYIDEDRDNSDDQRGHSQSQVNFTENGNNYSPSELEFDDIE